VSPLPSASSTARTYQNTLIIYSDWRAANSKVALLDGREVSIGTFPIGIEPSEFHDRLRTSGVQEMIRSMRTKFHGTKVVVGVDRLDCIKGIPQKLYAFDKFLERHSEWIGQAVLVQLVIPSRANLDAHQKLLVEIHKLVGEINGKYGKLSSLHFLSSVISSYYSAKPYTTEIGVAHRHKESMTSIMSRLSRRIFSTPSSDYRGWVRVT